MDLTAESSSPKSSARAMPSIPAISLLICTYNRDDFVSAAIGSVLKQTRADFELLVWDDGSTDATADGARRALGDDPRARIVRAPHAGYTRSIAAASRQLSAPYFGWVDSDD